MEVTWSEGYYNTKPIFRDNYTRLSTRRHTNEGGMVLSKLADGTLESPDTWEVSLSKQDGVSKREKWERLLREKKLGAMALMRNLRNMLEENVDRLLIRDALTNMDVSRVLPFRFFAANEASNNEFRGLLEYKMLESLRSSGIRLGGKTAVLVDVSGSMTYNLSQRSDMTRMTAAAALGVIAKELCSDCIVYSFSNSLARVDGARGLSGIDAIIRSQPNSMTNLAGSLRELSRTGHYDRVIVITDEQAQDAHKVGGTVGNRGYIINVAPYQHGISHGAWTRIDGFSEAVFRAIYEFEQIEEM